MKPDSRKYTQHDSTYMKFKKMQTNWYWENTWEHTCGYAGNAQGGSRERDYRRARENICIDGCVLFPGIMFSECILLTLKIK